MNKQKRENLLISEAQRRALVIIKNLGEIRLDATGHWEGNIKISTLVALDKQDLVAVHTPRPFCSSVYSLTKRGKKALSIITKESTKTVLIERSVK